MATRTETRRRNATQLAADGFEALVEKLGLADAIRYLQLYDQGEGDYTQERHKWPDNLSHADIAAEMAKAKKKDRRGSRHVS
jgi:hypothetical protein